MREELGSLSAQDVYAVMDGDGVLLADDDGQLRIDASIGRRDVAALKAEQVAAMLLAFAAELRRPPIPLHPRPGDPGVPAWWT